MSISAAEFKQMKQDYRDAKKRYENDPTPQNEQAMASLREAISLVVVIVVIAYMAPVALQAINGANTSGWTTSQIAMFSLLGILFIVAIYYLIFD